MGCRPALALLLLAAVASLHCCRPAAAAAGGMPALDAAGITLAHSVRHLLQAFDATSGDLQCSTVNQPYQVPLAINTPGRYRFRIKAKGSQGISDAVTSATVLVGKPSVPQNVSYSGGVGRVIITWEAPAADPDPAATQYWLYATPVVSSRRRLLGEGKTAFAELRPTSGGGTLAPAGGSGSFASPFSALVSIPAGNYTLQLSASNPNGYSGLSPSTAVSVGFSTKPRFWSVQGSLAGATLKIIRPDSVSEPTNLRYKITILRAGDSGSSGTFRDAAFETHTGTGTLDDPATISIPLSAFGAGVNYAQAKFVVVACNGTVSCAPDSDTSSEVTVGMPPTPTGLTFATASLDSVTVSWNKASTATSYKVELKQTGTGNSIVVSTAVVDGSGSGPFTKTFDNLTPGSYAVSVHSINANRDSSAAPADSTSDVVVGAPLAPTITSVTGSVGQLTVEWTAPTINADLGVTYKLNIEDVTTGRAPALEIPITLTAGAPTQTIPDLPAGTKRVWITATNSNAGDGKAGAAVVAAWAGAVQVELSTAPGIASSDGVVGSALGANISVTAPSAVSTAGRKLNKFLIQAYHATEDRELGRPAQVDASPADNAGPWTVFWSQTAPQRLRFKVSAQSDDRTVTSPWSGFTAVVAVGTPAQPVITSSQGGISSVTVSWSAVDTAKEYRARIKRSGELVYTRTVTAPATTHTENSLGWGMYTVEVAAVSDNGVSGQDATTSPLTVGAPGKLAAAPTATGGIGNLTLEWEKPADNPDPANTVFFAKVYTADGSSLALADPVSLAGASGTGTAADKHKKTIPLSFGTYKVAIFGRIILNGAAVNGDGEESDKSSPTTVELSNAPAIIGAKGFSNRVELKVVRPDTLANVAALSYTVKLYTASDVALPGDLLVPSSTTGTGTIYNAAALTILDNQLPEVPGQYKFEVVALGGPTNVTSLTRSDVVTVGVPPTPSITASSGGQSSATITWSASPTTAYYLVELLSQGVVKKSARVEHRDGDSSYTTTFNNTAAGTYTLRLTAVNDNQLFGSASTTGDVIVGVPGQPRLAAATGSVGKAIIGWETAISDPNPGNTTYWLRTYLVSTTDGTWDEQGAAVKADTSPMTRNLPAGVYRFAMFASNTNGDGPDSDLTDPITVGFANQVTGVTAVGTRDQANITFTAPSQLSTAQVSKFRVQAIREDGLVVEAGRELTLASGVADGTADLQLVFTPASGNPQRLKFRLAATDGTFAGDWSAESNVVTVGQPGAPTIRSSSSQLDEASVTFDPRLLTIGYSLRLLRCTGTTAATCTEEAGTKSSASAGSQTFALISTAGLYAIEVTATAANGVASNPSLTPILLVGKPGAPAAPTVVPGVGRANVTWTAPTVNPDATGVVEATSYMLQVYAEDDENTPVSTQALPGVSGPGPFTQEVTLFAGTWKAKIVATNRHGNSVSGLSAAFTVAVTDKPIITNDAQGSREGLTLTVVRPSAISELDARFLTYLVQLYDGDTGAKLGNEMRVNSNGGDGSPENPFSFFVPYTKPQRVRAEVIADAGSTRTVSDKWPSNGAEVVGTPNKPVITAISGSASSDAPHTASITFNKTYTAAEYNIKLFDALGDDATPVDSKLLTPAGNDADASWTFTGLTKGLYRFEVTAINEHNAESDPAESNAVVVGKPDTPTGTTVTPDVGKITLSWTAAASNARIGTGYTALLYRPTNTTAPFLSLTLNAAGTAPFTETLALPAGPYRLEIATKNVHGDGGKSGLTVDFTVGVSSSPTIVGVAGDAGGATLDVMRPDNMSDDAVATYLIQAYSDAAGTAKVGSEVRGNNSRSGADGKSQDKAFVFRYPYASAAELWFKVTVVVGTTRSDASMVAPQSSDGVVVGTPATPRLISPTGSADKATFTFTEVPTATEYIVTVFKDGAPLSPPRLVDAAGQQTWMLTAAELGVEPGQFTFSVVAKNAKGESQNATTQPLIVGTPGAPSWTTANRVVTGPGTATLSWTAPEYNARIGTRYYAQLWRDANTRFGDLVALTPAAGTNGTEAAPFTATMRVTAGSWLYQITTSNEWGSGEPSATFGPVVQSLGDAPEIKNITGAATNATLRFLKPSNAGDQDTIVYRAQLYDATSGSDTKLGSPVVLNVTSGAGTDADPYVATLGPFSRPLIIKVSIQATGGAGSVSTDMSDKSEAAVVGIPAQPAISESDGGVSEVSVSWAAVSTAVSYNVDVYDSSNQRMRNATVTSGTTHSETGLAAGMYTIKVAAVNVNGDASPEATTAPLTVGKPGKLAAAPTATGGIGILALTWQRPASDPAPASTEFFARVYNSAGTTVLLERISLAGPTVDGNQLSKTISLSAGQYKVAVFGRNVNGDGDESDQADATVELSNKPAVIAAIGYADKVELRVLRPDSVANPAALSYKVDVHNKDGSAVADKQGLVPTADSAPGTIYNATTLTLTLGQLTSGGAPGQFRFRVVAVGGPSNMPAEELTSVVTVGVPATPAITASRGGATTASATWSASPTSAAYVVELLLAGVPKKSARVEHSDATSYTQVFEQVAPGTYTIRVTAVNDNNPAKTSVSTTAAQTGNLVVGTPSRPAIDQAIGSSGLTASVSFSKVPSAVNYTILLVDVNNSANNVSEVFTPDDNEAGPFTRALTAPRKGTYRFEVTASNQNNATKTVSGSMVVGLPEAPNLPADAVTPGIGKITLRWTADAVNNAIGTSYNALLYRPQNLATPYLNLTLKAEGTASFAEEVALPAGPYKLEISTANEWGKGGKSSMTAEFTVAISSAPKIVSANGDASGALLSVLQPDTLADDAVATYLIQAHSDAGATTKVGSEVRGNNTAAGADGKTQATAFVFRYPTTSAAELYFTVIVVVGGTRSPASNTIGPVVVGTPATPRLGSPLGGKDAATFTFTGVPTATKYIMTASKDGSAQTFTRNVTEAGTQTWSLADHLGGEPGQFTFSVVAENANGESQDATTPSLTVGIPGAPTWAASNPVVVAPGTARLTWTAPAYNAKIGTRYYLQLWRDNGATKFGGLVALAPTGTSPFTATINVTAGSWSYQLFTNNTWGPGGTSDKTGPVSQPLSNDSDPPVIQSLERGATVATLRFRKPAAMSDQDDLVYRAQLYNASANPPTKLGDPVVLNITSGAGTAGSPYVATVGPFAQPLRITAAVQATGGAGSVSTALSAQSTPVVVGLPLVPQIESLEGSKTELRLKWLKNDTTVTSYRISVFKAGQFVSPVVEVPLASLGSAAGTPDSPYSFAIPAANLPDANRYAVKVAGVNDNGAGPWSALSEVAVYGAPAAPGAPSVTLVDPTVRLIFNKSDSTAVKYSAFIKPTTGAEVEVPLAVRPVTSSTTELFAVVGPDPAELPQGGTYTLQVAAYNANDDLGTRSAASAQFQLGTVAPSVPLAVTATSPSPLTASLAFQAPASNGGSAITSYEVELFQDGESKGVRPFRASTLGQTQPFRISLPNLAPGSWTFVVTAVNKNGRTDAPATVAITVRDVPPTKPAIAAISGADSTLVNGAITQTISLSVLKPSAGGEVTAWSFSLLNSARSATFISNRPFTASDGEGTTTDPYTATLTIANIPDGVYAVTVTATTATGSATSNSSPLVALGTPPTPTIIGVTSTAQNVTVRVTVPQTVTVAARTARSLGAAIVGGTTTASQPSLFAVTLSPSLGGRPITAGRLRAQGSGTATSPYVLVVPVATANEWTVQAVSGSNTNGASEAADSVTVVATGTPAVATALTATGGLQQASVTFTSAPWWSKATTVRVNVINNATGASAANLVLGSTFLTKPSSNRWTVKIGTGGTATAPIPRAGVWRFQVALVNSLNLQPALSAQTLGVEVGAPYQVGRPFISQNASAGVIMNVAINRTLTTAGVTNPPSVRSYIVRIFRGPSTASTFLRNVTFTAAQAATTQAISLTADGANTYSVFVIPVGVNGQGVESVRSAFVNLQARRTVTPRTGRKLAGVEEEARAAGSTRAAKTHNADIGAPHKRRSRHLL